ncbi:MAG: protein kinase [Planctomycetes bacterium]|nr:protein kinase [Planctomycetota bacterium]
MRRALVARGWVTTEQLASLGPLAPGPLGQALVSQGWVSSEQLASLAPKANTTLRFDQVLPLDPSLDAVPDETAWGEKPAARPSSPPPTDDQTAWGEAPVSGTPPPTDDQTAWSEGPAAGATPPTDDQTVWSEGPVAGGPPPTSDQTVWSEGPVAGAPPPTSDQTAWEEGPARLGSGVPVGRDPARFVAHYEIVEELGRGAMGTVHRALDTHSGRHVAIKRMIPGISSAVLRERFGREGELAGRLSHPGIIGVHDFGESGGAAYLVCELVEGAQDFLSALAGESVEGIVARLRDAALALGHAHARGIIHRDVKPDNLLIGDDGRVRVADFGLAAAGDLERLTQTGALLGTPAYMAPEQVMGLRELGPQVDVWALGVILYEILTRRRPFAGASIQGLFHLIRAADPTLPHTLDPEVWPSLEAICLKALSADSADRYPDARAMADDLDRALEGEATEALPVRPRPAWVRRAPWLLIPLAAFGLVAGAVGLGTATSTPTPAPAPSLPASATPTPQPLATRSFSRRDDQLLVVSGIGQRLNLLHLDPEGRFQFSSQPKPNGAWSGWTELDIHPERFVAAAGRDERLELFWIARKDAAVFHVSQNLLGGWGGEIRSVGYSARSLALVRDFNARLLLVAGTEDGAIFQQQGVVNGPFDQLNKAGAGRIDQICGERNSDERLEFAMVIGGVVLRSHQATKGDLANGSLVRPYESQMTDVRRISMIRRADGVLELFVLNSKGELLRTRQNAPGEPQWGKPKTVAVGVGEFAVTRAPGRRLALFVSDREGWISERWQGRDKEFGSAARVRKARGSSVTAAQSQDESVVLAWIDLDGRPTRAQALGPGLWKQD